MLVNLIMLSHVSLHVCNIKWHDYVISLVKLVNAKMLLIIILFFKFWKLIKLI